MPIAVERLPDEAILICTYTRTVGPDDLRHLERESVALTSQLTGPVVRISDTRELELSFSSLVIMLMDAARARNNPGGLNDPKFKDVVVTKPDSLVAFGAKSMGQDQYGKLNLAIYDSLDDALAHARQGHNP